MDKPRITFPHEPTQEEKNKLHEDNLARARRNLDRMMSEAGLFPTAQERLRKLFNNKTDTAGHKYAVRVEKQIQAEETTQYHQDHAAEYLAAVGVKLEELPTGERVQ
jgi:hypothetical protein